MKMSAANQLDWIMLWLDNGSINRDQALLLLDYPEGPIWLLATRNFFE